MKVHVSLDTCADIYSMSDAWKAPKDPGEIVDVPEYAWEKYQEAQEAYDFWQSYIAEKMDR